LLNHVRRLVHGAGEHEFPVEAGGFHFHNVHGHRQVRIVDGDYAALWADQLHRRIPMAHVIEDRDVIHELHAECAHLGDHIFAMIDDMVCAKRLHPGFSFGPGRCRDNGQARMFRQLNANGANTATSTDDEDALAFVRAVSVDTKPIKERFIGRDCGEGEGCGLY
jgi:hypothetical protein